MQSRGREIMAKCLMFELQCRKRNFKLCFSIRKKSQLGYGNKSLSESFQKALVLNLFFEALLPKQKLKFQRDFNEKPSETVSDRKFLSIKQPKKKFLL